MVGGEVRKGKRKLKVMGAPLLHAWEVTCVCALASI